jgi:drug/metabolite transporter (DMT)-like permease
MTEKTDLRPHAALLFVQITFGAFHVVCKFVLGSVEPLAVAATRILISTPLLLLLAYRTDPRMPSRADLGRLTVLGVLYIAAIPTGVNYDLNTWALGRSFPALVAAYTTLQPAAAVLLAVPFLRERLGWREALGFTLLSQGRLFVSGRRGGESPEAARG